MGSQQLDTRTGGAARPHVCGAAEIDEALAVIVPALAS